MKYNNTKDTSELLLIFSTEVYSQEGIESALKKTVEYYSKNSRHQYHVISHFVNEKMKKSQDSISYVLNNIDSVLAYLYYNRIECNKVVSEISDRLSVEDIILDLEKLYDHISLEEERIKNNAAIIRKSNQEIERNVVNTFNSIIDSFRNRVDEISNSLNANIITVVGLFSAIIFVFFGGITAMSSFVNQIFQIKSFQNLRYPMIMLLTIGFILFNTIFFFLYAISKIVDKNIGTKIIRRRQRHYNYRKNGNNCFQVYEDDIRLVKCFTTLEKAEKYIKKRSYISKVRAVCTNFIKKALLRFPYVVLINSVLLFGIVFLFIK